MNPRELYAATQANYQLVNSLLPLARTMGQTKFKRMFNDVGPAENSKAELQRRLRLLKLSERK